MSLFACIYGYFGGVAPALQHWPWLRQSLLAGPTPAVQHRSAGLLAIPTGRFGHAGVRTTASPLLVDLNAHPIDEGGNLLALTPCNGRFAQSVGNLCRFVWRDFIRDPLPAPKLKIDPVGFSIGLRISIQHLLNRRRP